MKNLILGIFVLIFAALASCKVDVDPTTDINTVEFSIKTEDDSLAKGATVLIYGSEEAYNTAYANFDTTGKTADTTLIATDGKFFIDLNSKKTYWVRVLYSKDTTGGLISGKIPFSNDEKGVQFGPFESNNFDGTKINTYATITLSKAYSILIVAAKDNSNVNVKVSSNAGKCIKLSDSIQLSNSGILDVSNLPSTLTDIDKTSSKYLVFIVPMGKIKIYYINSFGCVSTVEKDISGGGSIEKDLLEPCTNGNITFYNKTSNLTDIEVVLNTSDFVGTLSDRVSSSYSPSCGEIRKTNSFVTISRPLGVYEYFATSKSGNCDVTGNFKLEKIGQCVSVEIKMCK